MAGISVIIPLYNKGAYISRALESVFAQTYQDYEVIVVDDGSTDDGPEIVKGYADRRLKLVEQENAGPGAARNRGLAESASSLLSFLDGDDEWMPEFLETGLKVLEDNPACDAVASAYFMGKQREDASPIFRKYGMVEGPWSLTRDISDEMLKHAIHILGSSSTVIRRYAVERYGGFYERDHCVLGEDYYLWLQVMLNHRIYRILKPLWWFHTEASELGTPEKRQQVLQPFLTDADAIRKNCPRELADVLERWLAMFALGIAHECSSVGNTAMAQELADRFPLMKNYHWEYAKLSIKNQLPQLVPAVRYVKENVSEVKAALKRSVRTRKKT